jgi:hypothetical protein
MVLIEGQSARVILEFVVTLIVQPPTPVPETGMLTLPGAELAAPGRLRARCRKQQALTSRAI